MTDESDDDADAIRVEIRPSPELVAALEDDVYPSDDYPELKGVQDRFVRAAGDVVRIRRQAGPIDGFPPMRSEDLERLLRLALERGLFCPECLQSATDAAIEAVE